MAKRSYAIFINNPDGHIGAWVTEKGLARADGLSAHKRTVFPSREAACAEQIALNLHGCYDDGTPKSRLVEQ